MNVSEDLRNKAVGLGLCHKWQRLWNTNTDKDELVEMYKRGLDFCIENNYPTNEYMLEHFDGVMQKHGVFVSNFLDLKNVKQVVLNGECSGYLAYDMYSVGNIYVRHNSKIDIVAKENAKVFVTCYDSAVLDLRTEGRASITVYNYGSERISHYGNVQIKDRHE